ncbi:DUF3352 domain-containing protein [Gillisia sp. M10.2A]|uniref:DUF3352 domain-containing protein n=1 Tax=Gillisia lutea TaxID=2909668 RepID=A0ABS9EDD6_9FLAO|nr:DUF3352 domain-containing protein [Gillisia lutea]MCF4100894.1 DUF3352 domain-containing protein [Gillisia lutea]
MKKLVAAFIAVVCLISCQNNSSSKEADLLYFIPKKSAYIIKTTQATDFYSAIDSSQLLNKDILIESGLKNGINFLQPYLQSANNLICLVPDKNRIKNYLLITTKLPDNIDLDSIQNKSVETFKLKGTTYKKYSFNKTTVFTSFHKNTFLVSNSKSLLESVLTNAEERLKENPALRMAFKGADKKKSSIFINHNYLDTQLDKIFPNLQIPIFHLADWSVLDLDINNKKIAVNGITTSNFNKDKLLKVFQNVGVYKNDLAKVTPTSSAGFYSFTYAKIDNLEKNLANYRNDSLQIPPDHILRYSKEAGIIYSEKSKVLALQTTDPTLAADVFETPTIPESEFRGEKIYNLLPTQNFLKYLNPLVEEMDLKFYVFIESFMVFSEDKEALQDIISNFQNGSTLENQEFYQSSLENLTEASSLMFVTKISQFKTVLKQNLSEDNIEDFNNLKLDDFSIAALQFVQNEGFAHVHGVLDKSENSNEKIQETTSIKLEAPVSGPAYVVQNHENNQPEIAVQDEKNQLYLFSTQGKLLWKKQLSSQITGKIHQVDLFKNGNLQLAFSTQSSLEIIDRNGNTVKPFPIEFKDAITQPLAIMDYDNNRNYRFVITQGKNALMYDKAGKLVKGFDFKKTENEISNPPKHIRVKNKDYILVPEVNGKLHILSRQGKERITVKGKIELSENAWYLYKDDFISISSTGELLHIDQQGKITRETIAYPLNVKLDADKNNLVWMSENFLNINGVEITMDFGLYTSPKLHVVNGKTYIAVTDTQAQRVYVFNNKGKLLSNFPVYGTSEIDMSESKNEGFAVKAEDDSILYYRF